MGSGPVQDDVGAPEAAPTNDDVTKAGIADHRAGDPVGGLGGVALDPTEAAGVLVDIEQQRDRAVELLWLPAEARGEVAEDRCRGLAVGAPTSVQPSVGKDARRWR